MSELHPIQRENIGKAIGVTVHPKYTHAVALAGLAKHYFGGGVPMAIGGILIYYKCRRFRKRSYHSRDYVLTGELEKSTGK